MWSEVIVFCFVFEGLYGDNKVWERENVKKYRVVGIFFYLFVKYGFIILGI